MSEVTILDGFLSTAEGVFKAFVPLMFVLLIFQIFFLKLPAGYILNLLKGAALASAGLILFLQGVHGGFLPYGHVIGEALGGLETKWLAIPVGLLLGFLTARSEPAVRVLCDQVEEASSGSISKNAVLWAICIGVAIMVGIGMARVVYAIPLLYILIPAYLIALALLFFSHKEYTAMAFDAGGVASGPMTNTLLLGLGIGLSAGIGGQDAAIYGLGMVALVAAAPLVSVMILGILMRIKVNRERRI